MSPGPLRQTYNAGHGREKVHFLHAGVWLPPLSDRHNLTTINNKNTRKTKVFDSMSPGPLRRTCIADHGRGADLIICDVSISVSIEGRVRAAGHAHIRTCPQQHCV